MKRLLVIGLMALTMFSISAFANGPLLGVEVVPTVGSVPTLHAGWDFGVINIEASTRNFSTYAANPWTIGALWTPQVENFGWRAGARLVLGWTNPITYDGFEFVVGASSTWGPIQLYGDLILSPFGRFVARPSVGVNILFGDLIPDTNI